MIKMIVKLTNILEKRLLLHFLEFINKILSKLTNVTYPTVFL